ncbi:MAG: polysaccharide deacetylase family protein [Sulfuricaulis sp.]
MLSSRHPLVLTYHRVIPRDRCADGRRPPNTLFTDEFDEQMAFVSKRFNVLSGEELLGYVDGNGDLPRYSLAITFDDGYENNYSHALPVLQRYGLHAMFFLTTNLIGNRERSLWFDRLDKLLSSVPISEFTECMCRLEPSLSASPHPRVRAIFKSLSNARQMEILDRLENNFGCSGKSEEDAAIYGMMSWDQVRALASAGMTVGSHTANHQILTAASPVEVRSELQTSRRRIEEETGHACRCFAYPNGGRQDFRPSDERAVQDAGYQCAFTQISGSIHRHSPRFALPRIPIPDAGDMRIFRSHLSGIQHAFRTVFPEN